MPDEAAVAALPVKRVGLKAKALGPVALAKYAGTKTGSVGTVDAWPCAPTMEAARARATRATGSIVAVVWRLTA